jgi:CTP:molybdopterin cytidylyltransferase MocA
MNQQKTHISAVITAAGESTRMGQPKPLLRWGDRTFLEAMVRTLETANHTALTAVVIGADRESILEEVQRLDVEPLLNPDYRAGRFTSIRVAARWAREKAAGTGAPGALLLWPVDCPGVAAATLSRICKEAFARPTSNIVPAYEGRAGHPVILCERFLEIILATDEGGNLRELMRYDQITRRGCSVNDPAVLDNLNGPEDYEAFLQSRPAIREDRANDGEAERVSQS